MPVPGSPGWLLRQPLVSVAGFKAHPTFLDLQNLRSGDTNLADQDAQLLTVLMEASDTAQGRHFANQPLQAHINTQYGEARTDRWGKLSITAENGPVRRLISLSYGIGLTTQIAVTSPTYRVVDDYQIQVELSQSALSWQGSLQFGPPLPAAQLLTTCSYVAGFANSVLTATANSGTATLTVADPTGIEPLDILRIWDPGSEEQVQVASTYSPAPSNPPVATAIPLASNLAATHASGVHVSSLPADAYTGIIYLAVDMLQKPGTAPPSFPGSRVRAATAKNDPAPSVYWQRAQNLLRPYATVR